MIAASGSRMIFLQFMHGAQPVNDRFSVSSGMKLTADTNLT
jgi:hypothetical protein